MFKRKNMTEPKNSKSSISYFISFLLGIIICKGLIKAIDNQKTGLIVLYSISLLMILIMILVDLIKRNKNKSKP